MAITDLSLPMLAALQTWHIIVFLAVVLLLFGGRKLPELAKGMAKGMRIFRDELRGVQKDMESPAEPEEDDEDEPMVRQKKDDAASKKELQEKE